MPEDPHEPYVKDFKIEIVDNKEVRFWLHLTTTHLMERLENNPLKLFQLDPTYKLMHEGFPVLVHGTSMYHM